MASLWGSLQPRSWSRIRSSCSSSNTRTSTARPPRSGPQSRGGGHPYGSHASAETRARSGRSGPVYLTEVPVASVCSRASSSVTVARFSRAGVAPVPSGRTGRGHGAHPARHPERRSSPPSRPRSRADRPPQGEEAGRRPETRRRRLDRGILRLAGRTRPGPVSIRPSRPEARGPAPPRCQRYGEGSARTPASHPVRSIGTPRSERLSATEPLSPGGPQPPSPHAPRAGPCATPSRSCRLRR